MFTQPLYFAYGSNLNKHDWNRNGFRPPFDDVFEKVANAWLPGHTLTFTFRSAVRDGGVLDVIERQGCCVPGALFRLKNWEGKKALDEKEGWPFIYPHSKKQVLTNTNALVEAFTYTICPERREGNFIRPSEELACNILLFKDVTNVTGQKKFFCRMPRVGPDGVGQMAYLLPFGPRYLEIWVSSLLQLK